MTTSFLSSRDFNRDPARAKRAAKNGPVFVTERSKPSLVVLSIEDYEKLAGQNRSLADVLTAPEDLDFEFDAARAMPGFKAADLD
ncbi:type II toxin-antitoxin system prevent-host-death family antitoxin [Asticcacaulis solisilvae]|uniref:type II toxin-antitoxin system prevent-host-death family antitoxin n=1 Tax=Asticcacaulis solisilvae TaxID=1217274 RepID=UPI003FD8C6F5